MELIMNAALKLNLPTGYTDELGRPMGLYLDMPEGVYHKIPAFSYSGSKQLRKSGAHYQAYLEKEWECDPMREQFKAVHLLTLEPHMHAKIVVKDGRWAGALKEEVLKLQSEGKIVLKQDGLDDAKAISSAIKKHRLAGSILSKSLGEVSLFWSDEETGVYCKARIDLLYVDSEDIIIGDLKNFGDLSNDRNVWKFIHDNRFYWQQFFYGQGIKAVFGRPATNHHWFFVESDKPHGVRVCTATDAMLELAEEEMKPLIGKFKEYSDKNEWPGYPDDAEPAGLPSYAFEIY
jgi:hypothetical protein